jgi:3-oxoacyl-(acyl-carrier-protein) synthase
VWNRKRDPISLRKLGNVGAGHVSQELLGNYGPMVSPVGACPRGNSVETACGKLRLRRADLMAACAFDDISYAGTLDSMKDATSTLWHGAHGIPPQRMSRPQDGGKGFVESHAAAR